MPTYRLRWKDAFPRAARVVEQTLHLMDFSFTPEQLRQELQPVREAGQYHGAITAMAALDEAGPGALSFLGNKKYRPLVAETMASVVLLPPTYLGEPRQGQLYLFVENPSVALARLCAIIEEAQAPSREPGIHPEAVVDPTAEVSPEASVGPLCTVGAGTKIGPGTILHPQVALGAHCEVGADCELFPRAVVMDRSVLGDRVRLLPGAVIGADGFGFEPGAGVPQRLPQVGRVILEDDVEIGANSTIDRARFAATVIGQGTKIDNLVQIAHNCRTGKSCLLAAQVGISGSTTLGDGVMIGGQAGLAGHIQITDKAMIGAQTGLDRDIEEEGFFLGAPAVPGKLFFRLASLYKRLPELFAKVRDLEEKVR